MTTPIPLGLADIRADITKTLRRRPRVALILDDGLYSHYRYAFPDMARRGQKASVAIHLTPVAAYAAGYYNPGEMRTLADAGWEILGHSKTHPNMVSMASAARQAEWDDPQTFFAAELGPGKVNTFVYPSSASSLETDAEGWGSTRYRRFLTGGNTGDMAPYRFTRADLGSPRTKYGRWSLSKGNLQETKDLLASLTSDETLLMYTHSTGGNDANALSPTEFGDLMEYCVRLGIDLVTVSEALPRPAVDDPDCIDLANFAPVGGTAPVNGSYAQGTGQAITGLGGSTSLQLSRTVTTTGSVQIVQKRRVRIKPGVPYTLSARVKLTGKTGGAGGASLMITSVNDAGNSGGNIESAKVTANGSYATVAVEYTGAVATTVPYAQESSAALRFRLTDSDGTADFRHIHFGPTADGVLG